MKWTKRGSEFVAKSNGYRCTVWRTVISWHCEVKDGYIHITGRSGFRVAATAQNYAERALERYLRKELKRITAQLGGAS